MSDKILPPFYKIMILLFILIAMTSCTINGQNPNEQESQASAYLTLAAQTAEVVVTATPVQLATLTPTPGTPTATPPSCYDSLGFIADVSIPDGKQIEAGEIFVKTWRFRNNGTCIVSAAYDLIFVVGDIMGAEEEQKLIKNQIPPGGIFDVSVELVAPLETGNYRGYWMVRNIHGVDIGIAGNEAFYVEINVIPSTTITVTPSQTPDSQNAQATPSNAEVTSQPVGTAIPTVTPLPSNTPLPTSTPTQSILVDLIIMNAVIVPEQIASGGVINIVIVVKNQGISPSPPFSAVWYADFDAGIKGCEWTNQTFPQTNEAILNCAYQGYQDQSGKISTMVIVDDFNLIPEANETNNRKQIDLIVVE